MMASSQAIRFTIAKRNSVGASFKASESFFANQNEPIVLPTSEGGTCFDRQLRIAACRLGDGSKVVPQGDLALRLDAQMV